MYCQQKTGTSLKVRLMWGVPSNVNDIYLILMAFLYIVLQSNTDNRNIQKTEKESRPDSSPFPGQNCNNFQPILC